MQRNARILLTALWVLSISLGVLMVSAAAAQTTAPDFSSQAAAKQNKGDLDGAIADYTRAIELDPKNAAAYLNRSVVKKAQGDPGGAMADYLRAIELDPEGAPAYNSRGNAKRVNDDLDGAIADYTRAIELDPKYFFAFMNRATTRQAKGDLDGAIADYSRAIELDPKFATAYNIRGAAYLLQRRWTDSLADFRRKCELEPKDLDYPHIYIWMIRMRLDEKDAANEELAAYLQTRGKGAAREWEGQEINFLLGRISEADLLKAAASKVVERDSEQRCEAWFSIGIKQLLAGEKTGVSDSFKKCLAAGEKTTFEYQLAEAELKALGTK